MRFTRRANFDWEPALLNFRFVKSVEGIVGTFESEVLKWFRQRDHDAGCPCQLEEIIVRPGEDEKTITLSCEWLCKVCLPRLIEHLGKAFPTALECVGGVRKDGIKPNDGDLIAQKNKRVELESGQFVDVPPFFISLQPVSLIQFNEFVVATSYVTSAERAGSKEVYHNNASIRGIPWDEVKNLPVCCVSYLDAVAYCAWANVELPSEAEWLAAAIIDDKIYDEKEYRNLFTKNRRFKLADDPHALEFLGHEWTNTSAGDGRIVIRTGPTFVKITKWKEMVSQHRWLVNKEFFDVTVSFRFVKRRVKE